LKITGPVVQWIE